MRRYPRTRASPRAEYTPDESAAFGRRFRFWRIHLDEHARTGCDVDTKACGACVKPIRPRDPARMAAFILFSDQELIYLAQWCRMAATLSRQYGAAESSVATKEIYEQSAQSC